MKLILRTREEGGRVHSTWLIEEDGNLAISDEAEVRLPLPPQAVAAVFERYGRELEATVPPLGAEEPSLELVLPGPGRLRAFKFLGYGDVLPSDYLLLESDGRASLAAPAPLVAEALLALARAAARSGAKELA